MCCVTVLVILLAAVTQGMNGYFMKLCCLEFLFIYNFVNIEIRLIWVFVFIIYLFVLIVKKKQDIQNVQIKNEIVTPSLFINYNNGNSFIPFLIIRTVIYEI